MSITELPSEGWTLDQLAEYARRQIVTSRAIENSLGLLGRRSTVAFFRAGRALLVAREQLKTTGDWVKWQDDHQLPRTTVFEAISLYEAAKDEKAVETLALTEAKRCFGISGSTQANGRKTMKPRPTKVKGDPNDLVILLSSACATLDAMAARLGDEGVGAEQIEPVMQFAQRMKEQVDFIIGTVTNPSCQQRHAEAMKKIGEQAARKAEQMAQWGQQHAKEVIRRISDHAGMTKPEIDTVFPALSGMSTVEFLEFIQHHTGICLTHAADPQRGFSARLCCPKPPSKASQNPAA